MINILQDFENLIQWRETLKKARSELKVDLKNSISQFKNSEESLTSGIYQVEERVSRIEIKVEDLDK